MISARYFSSEIHESVKTEIQCHCEEVPSSETDYYHAGFFAQTYHLTKRAFWNHTVHPGFYWAKLAINILLDFVMASIFNRSQSVPDPFLVGLLYFVLTVLVLLTIAGKEISKIGLLTFSIKERKGNKNQFLLTSTFVINLFHLFNNYRASDIFCWKKNNEKIKNFGTLFGIDNGESRLHTFFQLASNMRRKLSVPTKFLMSQNVFTRTPGFDSRQTCFHQGKSQRVD